MYDPDAPTQSGFWHWAVADIPAERDRTADRRRRLDGLRFARRCVPAEERRRRRAFIGAAPPAGHGTHRYFVTVHALDVEKIGVGPDASPANLGFNIFSHSIGRATLVATGEIAG